MCFKTEINTSASHTATLTILRGSLLTLQFISDPETSNSKGQFIFPGYPITAKPCTTQEKRSKPLVCWSPHMHQVGKELWASGHNYNKKDIRSKWMELYTYSLPKPATSPTEQNSLLFFIWTILTACQKTLYFPQCHCNRSCSTMHVHILYLECLTWEKISS